MSRMQQIRSRAPIRVDFAGGWTDVKPFSQREGGAVLNATINRYTYATLVTRTDRRIRIHSGDFDLFVEVKEFKQIEYDGNLDVIKAAIKLLGIRKGMDLYVRCDAPPGSGTGSSASISVALIGLLNVLQSQKLSLHQIVELAHRMEIEELKIAGGKQDQYASALGGFNYLEFKDPMVSNSPVRVSRDVINELEKHLILCYTGKSRLSGNIIRLVMGKYRRGDKGVVSALRELREIATEMKSALLREDLKSFARLLSLNWKNQKQLHPTITNEQIEGLFRLAKRNGALGGKALGAGGGGCLLFYCADNREHLVRGALEQAGARIIEFNFEFNGLQTWSIGKGGTQ